MGGACSMKGGKDEAYGLLVGKPKRNRPLGRPRCKGWIILRCWRDRMGKGLLTGLVWLRIGTSGELL
jgi:hypothetical protein